MRLSTVEQAARIDETSQKDYGLSGETLMEAAGVIAAREIALTYLPELTRGSVAIICGPGNNGGDGLVVARHLHSSGHRNLVIFLLAPTDGISALFRVQLRRAELQDLKIVNLIDKPDSLDQIQSAELIVDALFGIGLKRKVEGAALSVIEAMNSAKAPTVSLDAPSGLNSDTGRVEGAAVKAAMTLTFGLAKPGFFVAEGHGHVGKLRILPIGFPNQARRQIATSHFLFNERLVRRYLPGRKDTSNKSDHGRLLVLAGREGFWGAGILASTSAFRMGAGYVQWASFEAPFESLQEIPEVLTGKIGDEGLWRTKFSAACVGPGLGVGRATADVIEKLKAIPGLPVVVDADAITTCVDHSLFPLPKNWVLTPHTGELSRILKVPTAEIESDRFQAVFEASSKTGCPVLLKGFRSHVAFEGRCWIIHSGNSALAKAGTGDVLTGMIGGLLAQGLGTLEAASTAAFVHGVLADEWVRSGNDKSSLTASDLKLILPQVVSRLRLSGTVF
jgi:hydroxyethylthiazole kinase-like uncharacterized protein yjeF